jgi:hypothetical protein
MNIALFIREQAFKERFLLYVFLYTVGFNLIFWSIGSFLIFRQGKERFDLRSMFSAPVSSVFIALAIAGIGAGRFIPGVIFSSLETIGNSSFFLSLLVLGSALAVIDISAFKKRGILIGLLGLSLLKLMAVPLAVQIINMQIGFKGLLGFFILIQAAMPSAISLTVVGAWRKVNVQFLSAGIFLTTLLSAATIPFWLSFYRLYM